MTVTKVTAYQAKSRQAEIFRRAAAGEKFLVTNNDKPQVEICQVTPAATLIREAIDGLAALQQQQLSQNKGGSQKALQEIIREGRD